MRGALLVLLGTLLLPGFAAADDIVDVEMLIASSNGRYYVILQQDGEVELVRRSEDRPPIRSRRGEARPSMANLRLGGTAEEVARASGLTHGIEPEPGDAIIGTARLRDRLDRLDVFGDGTGFVARYSSSPTRYDDLEPIRGNDGADEGLVSVENKPLGEDRIVGSFVHLYTRKDSVFWGDPSRQLVMMVAGGDALMVSAERGAYLADRESGTRPRMVGWNYVEKRTVAEPMDALLDRIRSPDPADGLTAFLLARELDLRGTVKALGALVNDPSVPHPTRLHAATTLHAEGDGRGDALILGTARGVRGPAPGEAPLQLPTVAGAEEEATPPQAVVRAYAASVLPITHPDVAAEVLLSLAADPAIGEAARAALLAGPWTTTEPARVAAWAAARDVSREAPVRAAATRFLLQTTPAAKPTRRGKAPPVAPHLRWLATDPEPTVSAPVLKARPELADSATVPALASALQDAQSTPQARQDAAFWLARRAARSEAARDALLSVAGTPGAGTGAAEALAVLWRVPDPRVLAVLVQRSAGDGREADHALHSLLTAARRASDNAPWIAGLAKLPPRRGWRGRAVTRLLAVLDPSRVRWSELR